MGSLSKMASQCQVCRFRETCNHKMMQLEAYIDQPMAVSVAQPVMQPLLIDGDYLMKKEIEKVINKKLYQKSGLMYGA